MEKNHWERYFDTNSNAHYWYNNQTGESVWDDGLETAEENNNIIPTNNTKGEELEEIALIEKSEKKRQKRIDSGEDKQDSDLLFYSRYLLASAIFLESPLCVIEGTLRCLLLLLFVMYHYICKYLFKGNDFVDVGMVWRDILLTCAATLTLLCPFTILYIYKGLQITDTWYIAALPTIFGAVDCRRFGSVTIFGAGSYAANALVTPKFPYLDIWPNSAVFYPKNQLITWKEHCQRYIYNYRSTNTAE